MENNLERKTGLPASVTNALVLEKVLLKGDLSELKPEEKIIYYHDFCRSLGLNPVTQPFQIMKFTQDGITKEILYATKDCTEQLRKINHTSVVDVKFEQRDGMLICTAFVKAPDGRTDSATAVVVTEEEEKKWVEFKQPQGGKTGKYEKTGRTIPFNPQKMAIAYMKVETKAKRRATLSICGLGATDESELDLIDNVETRSVYDEQKEQKMDTSVGDVPEHLTKKPVKTSMKKAEVKEEPKQEIPEAQIVDEPPVSAAVDIEMVMNEVNEIFKDERDVLEMTEGRRTLPVTQRYLEMMKGIVGSEEAFGQKWKEYMKIANIPGSTKFVQWIGVANMDKIKHLTEYMVS